jgi:hypothetical protein
MGRWESRRDFEWDLDSQWTLDEDGSVLMFHNGGPFEFDELGRLEQASVLFEDGDHFLFELVFGLLERRPWIDIVVVGESSTSMCFPYNDRQDLVIGYDRVSRQFLKGVLNAQPKRLPSYASGWLFLEVTFDSEPKWPNWW